MRINVWISFNGFKEGAYTGFSFPYVATCPSKGRSAEYGNIMDVYNEITNLYDKASARKINLGESLYQYTFHFVDHALLLDNNMQNRIKEYQFCKQFSCPPYPSLQETPAKIIEQFSVIEEEFNFCVAKKQQEKKDA